MRADLKFLLIIAPLLILCAGAQASDKALLQSDARLRTDSYTEFGLDTGTGALRQSVRVMSLLGGVRKLDLDIEYNSMVDESSGFGVGWSHPFDGFITTSGVDPEEERPWRNRFPKVTVTYAGGRHTSSFTRSGYEYVPDGPFNLQDRLILDTGGEHEGYFKFTRPDGTTYLYDSTGIKGSDGKLRAVIDHNQSPIYIDRDKRGKITALKTNGTGLTFVGSQSISSSLRFHWLPQFGDDAVEQINTVERYSPDGSRFRHFAYGNENILRRIYDPVEVDPVPVFEKNLGNVEIPEGQSQRFTLNVGDLPSGRLLVITADIENGPATLSFDLEGGGGGGSIKLGHSGEPIRIMTDSLLAEKLQNRSPEQNWILNVFNVKERVSFDENSNLIRPEFAPTIVNSIKFQLADKPVGYTSYSNISALGSRKRTLLSQVSVSEGGEAPRVVRKMAYDSSSRLKRVSTNPDPVSGLGQSHQEISYFRDLNGLLYTDVYNRSTDLWLNRSSFNWGGHSYRRWVHTPELDLLSVTDAIRNTTQFEYDAEHRRTLIRDPLGNITQLGYTPEGQVASITWPNEAVSSFTYDELEPASVQTLPAQEILESYRLRVVKMRPSYSHPGANTPGIHNAIFIGIEEGTLVTIYRRLKHIRIYDNVGDIIFDRTYQFFRDNGENASDQAFEDLYTAANQWLTDRHFQTEANRHAIVGYLIGSIPESIDVTKKGNLQTITAPGAGVTTFHYNEYNNLICVKDALQGEQNITCNADGSVSAISNQGLDGIELGRDEEGRINTISQDGDDAPPQEVEYDRFGRVIEIKDSEDYATTYGYDDRDNLISVQGGGDPVLSEYDYRNRLIKKNVKMRGGVMKAETTYEYDIHNNVIKITNAADAVTSFEYDIEDRLIKVTNPRGFSDRFEYDAANRLIGKTDKLNNVTYYVYDAASNLIRTLWNGEIQSETSYNRMNLPSSTKDGEGNQTTFSYDDLGRLTGTTDPRGRTTTLEYDLLGRLVKTTDPLGREYVQSYFEDNVVEEVKLEGDPGGTSFEYTTSNEVKSIALPSGATTHFEYTANGFVKRFIPPNARFAQEYSYDSQNRLTRTNYAPNPLDTVYSYDDDGNLTSIGTQEGGQAVTPVINRTYDVLGRLLTHEDGRDKTIQYEYDAMGLVTRITYPNGNTVDYAYDGANRLLSTTDWAARKTEYIWNRFNQITLIAFPNSTFREMEYNKFGKLVKRTDYASDGTTIVSYLYTIDPKGRIVAEQVFPAIEPALPTAKDFTYGQDNQLTQMNGINISHDIDGNMTQGVIQGQSQVLTWTDKLYSVGSTYYRYNLQDRLIGWEKDGEEVFFTIVETSGRPRIFQSETSSGSTTQYVYGVGLTYEVTDGVLKVHHYDERGSTVALSDDQGAVSGRLSYAPYGEITSESGTVDTLFKFGGLWGTVTSPDKLNSMGFRWYSPEMSRFLSLDSVYGNLESPGSLNRYHFAFGDPVNLVDPNGETPWFAAAALVGAIAGVIVEFVTNVIEGRPHTAANYAAAAIGGAFGAVVGLIDPIAGGAVGAGATNLFKSAFNSEKVDVGSFFLDTFAGGLTGGLLGAAGDKLGNAGLQAGLTGFGPVGRVALSEIASSLAELPLEAGFKASTALINKGVNGLSQSGAFIDKLATSTSAGLRAHYNAPNTTSREGSGLKDYNNAFRIMERTLIKPTAAIGRGGEQAAYKIYLKAMRQADQRPPNPLLNLPAF